MSSSPADNYSQGLEIVPAGCGPANDPTRVMSPKRRSGAAGSGICIAKVGSTDASFPVRSVLGQRRRSRCRRRCRSGCSRFQKMRMQTEGPRLPWDCKAGVAFAHGRCAGRETLAVQSRRKRLPRSPFRQESSAPPECTSDSLQSLSFPEPSRLAMEVSQGEAWRQISVLIQIMRTLPQSKEDLRTGPLHPASLQAHTLKRDLRTLRSKHTDDPRGFCRNCRTRNACRLCIVHAKLLDVGGNRFLRKAH